MLIDREKHQAQKYEHHGICFSFVDEDGNLTYDINGKNKSELAYNVHSEEEIYCDTCKSLRIVPDTYDWFRQGNMRAICERIEGVIAENLDAGKQIRHIHKPLYCPKLGRKLNDIEQEEADEGLVWARERMD